MPKAYTQPMSNPYMVVQLTQEETGTPGSFPVSLGRLVYKALPCTVTYDPVEGSIVKIIPTTDLDRAIYVGNFRANNPILGEFYLVLCVAPGVYLLDNQMAFLANQ